MLVNASTKERKNGTKGGFNWRGEIIQFLEEMTRFRVRTNAENQQSRRLNELRLQ